MNVFLFYCISYFLIVWLKKDLYNFLYNIIYIKDNSKSTLYLQLFYLKKCHKMAIQRNDLENCKNNQTKNIIYIKY